MTIRKRISAADEILLSRVAAAGRPGLDRAMQGLGRAADNSALWTAVATRLGVRRNKWTRRAAWRGLAGMAIASTTGNVIVKQLVGGTRPDGPLVFLPAYRTWSASSLRVASLADDLVPLCLDGEATEMKPAISLIKRPRKLLVYRPATGDGTVELLEPISPNWRWQ